MINSPRLAGWLCLAGAGLGVLQGLLLLLYPAQVTPDRYSYPFTPAGHMIMETSLAVQHLLLLAGLVTIARCQPQAARLSRLGLSAAAVGMVLLTLMEILALTAADVSVDSSWAGVINTLYGIPSLVVGASLVLGGIGYARSGRLPGDVVPTGWRRWVPLIIGGYVFVPLLPAIMAPFVFGRLAIMGWMMTFALLGWMLIKPSNGHDNLDKISSRTLAASA